MTGKHEWVPSTLGHGETMCRHCRITNREAAVLGETDADCPNATKVDAKAAAPPITITISPTGTFEGVNGTRCRIWAGHMQNGDPVKLWIAMVEVPERCPSNKMLSVALNEVDLKSRDLVYFDNRMVMP